MTSPANCAILRTIRTLDDIWALGIVRCVFLGTRRFTPMQRELGIATNVLTSRLRHLVDEGILVRVPYQQRPLRHEYHLTDKGRDLAPVIVALRQWGTAHLEWQSPLPPFIHRGCEGHVRAGIRCDGCGGDIADSDITIPVSPDPAPGAELRS